jgi:hypothetical protein
MVSAGFKPSKSLRLTAVLATFVATSLASCAPRALPGSANPTAFFGANRAATVFSGQSSKVSPTDNFNQYIRNKMRSEGFAKGQEPEAIQGSLVQALPAAAGTKALTYMTYEALDNNLYEDLNRVVDTLELIGSNSQMNVLAQTDNYGAGNAARYFLQPNAFGKIESPYVALGAAGENSGDASVFADAVKWGFGSYPSRYKWLNISTHGMGFAGINYDDEPEQSLNIIQFGQALKAGLQGQKLDMISFDACLMATVEVASELKDSSNIMVGSEDSTYYWGKGYYTTFSQFAGNVAAFNPSQVARGLVENVHDKNAENQALTISATDLTKVGRLETELDKLARALRQALPQHKDSIIRAVKASQEFHLGEGVPFRDINRVAALLKQHVQVPEIAAICDQINQVMYRQGVILFARQGRSQQGQGRGLSIYLPSEGEVSQTYRQTRFAKETQWDEFLVELNRIILAG